jgi:hypothetical protein
MHQRLYTPEAGSHDHQLVANGDHAHNVTKGGDAETRSRNVYVEYIIKL